MQHGFDENQRNSTQGSQEVTNNGLNYLQKYGYIPKGSSESGALMSHRSIEKAVKQFQRFAGLKITGKLDADTMFMMKQPRCGVPDDVGSANKARKRRYALHGSKWGKKSLTYKISKYGRKMPRTTVDMEIRRAFDVWSRHSPLVFTKKISGPVDIDIKFERSWHGDNNPFDGPGQTLAHAFFPVYGGDAHFDEDEPWTVKQTRVAVHEFGHSLGLAHSDVYSALMAPFYKGYQPSFSLSRDDINAIQTLYGSPNHIPNRPPTPKPQPPQPRTTPRSNNIPRPRPFTPYPPRPRPQTPYPPQRPTTKSPVKDMPAICVDPRLDAITRTIDGTTYAFKGKYYYRLGRFGIDKGYPRPIDWDWRGVHGPVDAVLTWKNGYTFIFKGSKYWKFRNTKLVYGPNDISEGFKGVPNDITAAMVWGLNGKTYFFKGDKYYRYSGQSVEYGYPRPISKWRGLPNNIQAAFQWKNGRTYFFTGKDYYRYNDRLFTIDTSYPRPIAKWWLGCQNQGDITDVRDPYSMDQNSFKTEFGDEQWITIEDNGDNSIDKEKLSSDSGGSTRNLNILFLILVSVFSLFSIELLTSNSDLKFLFG
ncbi:hypothetical protein KUTeg_012032 [Tegillarca granosa]|uniref:Peptidase metallopeptidase domain-containing protein n=1 Tax=Tegillarca granosa TaxID=220873 RepID=A0ABQ9F2Q2_TEGGR|nr:hypothetical protein KUTeg_012032 [Tegillarca granosa]